MVNSLPYLPSDENCTGYWSFDEGNGSLAFDSSGGNNHGELINMTEADWVTGVSGYALDFEGGGADNYVNIPDYDPTGGSGAKLSVFCWVWIDTDNAGFIVCHWDTGASKKSFTMRGYSNSGTYLQIDLSSDGSKNEKRYRGSTQLDDSTWHLIGFTFNAGTLKLYVDGVEETVTKVYDNSISALYNSTVDLMIGAGLDSSVV